MEDARRRLAATTLGEVPAVAVSGVTGEGLPRLRDELAALVRRLPTPDVDADVRLWIDRSFSITGAGTVVTGTLAEGGLAVPDELELGAGGERVGVRGLQMLGTRADRAEAVARVAVNLRGVGKRELRRGDVLLTPGAWSATSCVDVAVPGGDTGELPAEVVVHCGSAAVAARVRPLGGAAARLTLRRGLPLRVGDRLLLRDPGRHRVLAGVDVRDVSPPRLRRRGAARARAAEVEETDPALAVLRHSGFLPERELSTMGLPLTGVEAGPGWRADPDHWERLVKRLPAELDAWRRSHPLQEGMPRAVAARALRLPEERLLGPLLAAASLTERDGRISSRGEPERLPEEVERSLRALLAQLRDAPFAAPDANRLAELGLGPAELAAGVRSGRLVKIADGVVLAAGSDAEAARLLADLPQPFTLSRARQHLGTTRRVAVPLLELLDRSGVTRRNPDGTHELRHRS
jgi:selenocysteine-specific elongation factor